MTTYKTKKIFKKSERNCDRNCLECNTVIKFTVSQNRKRVHLKLILFDKRHLFIHAKIF